VTPNLGRNSCAVPEVPLAPQQCEDVLAIPPSFEPDVRHEVRLLPEPEPPKQSGGRKVLRVSHRHHAVLAPRVERVPQHALDRLACQRAPLPPGESVIPTSCRPSPRK
jgi:hypothetical protein